ncbi:MAG: hypothetical protein CMF55_05900 [Legionellales bacterium]|nr:hypothetical protein [Legionellales bacterium]
MRPHHCIPGIVVILIVVAATGIKRVNVELIDVILIGKYQDNAAVKSVTKNAKIIVKNVQIIAAKMLLTTNGNPDFLRMISYQLSL